MTVPGLVPLPDDVLVEAKMILTNAELLMASLPLPDTIPVAEQRAANRAQMEPPHPQAVDRVVSALGRSITVRVLAPVDEPDGVYLHIHGGAWMMGGYDQQDQMLWDFGLSCNVTVVSVGYRLAPEHPFPACAEDCETAAVWLAENASAEFGAERLTIGGESAGAHLSAVTLLRLRERDLANRFCGANLVYGAYDLSMTPFAREWGERNLVLNTPIVAWSIDQLTPGWSEEMRRSSEVSPMYADLSGLPPALFTVGTDDPTLHDSIGLCEKWNAANANATLEVYEHGFHAANLFPSKLADLWNRSEVNFIRTALKGHVDASH